MKAILYTDGSFKRDEYIADANIGIYGAGAHGYVFDPKAKTDKSPTDSPANYYMTSTGYVGTNEYVKTIHKLVTPLYYIDAAYSFLNKGTAPRSELLGMKCSLNDLYLNRDILGITEVCVYSDCAYAIGVANKIMSIPTYPDNDEIPNKDLIIELKEVLDKYLSIGLPITVEKVDGHSTYLGNNIADELAFHARQQSGCYNVISFFNMVKIEKGKKYWNYSVDENELLKFKQLVFTHGLSANSTERVYSVMNYKTDVEIGSRTHDALMGLVSVKETPKIIDDVIKLYHEGLRTLSLLSVVNLRNLYSREVLHYYELFGRTLFWFNYRLKELSKRDKPIITAYHPPGLGNKLLGDIQFLYTFISYYRKIKDQLIKYKTITVNNVMEYIDITSYIYTENNKKKNVCSLPSSCIYIPIKATVFDKSIEFPLVLGKDTLERNQFKRLETDNPIVTLVIEKITDKSYRYYTIIECKEDIGIYCNIYTNRIITE